MVICRCNTSCVFGLATTAAAGKVQRGLTPLWLAQPQNLDVRVGLYAHSTVQESVLVCGGEKEKRVRVSE